MKRTITIILAALLCLQLAACLKIKDGPESARTFNNGGRYVSHGGDLYCWQNHAACIERSGLWGYFPEAPGIRRPMLRIAAGGGEDASLFTENGYGSIWIYSGRFYLTWLGDDNTPRVFSTAMEQGNAAGEAIDRRAHGLGELIALDEARGIFIGRDGGTLFALNAASGERVALAANAEFLLYDAPTVYYRDRGENAIYPITLRGVDVTSNEARDIAWIDAGAYEELETAQYIELGGARMDGDMLYFYMAGYGGSAYHYYGSVFLMVDLEGDAVLLNENPTESDWFGINKPFNLLKDGPFEGNGDDYGWYICYAAGEEPVPVLSEEEIAGLGLPKAPFYGDDDFADIRDVEYADGMLYFSIVRGPRNPDEDIGWREAYDFGSAHVYRKDIAAGTIDELYFFGKDTMGG